MFKRDIYKKLQEWAQAQRINHLLFYYVGSLPRILEKIL